MKALEGELQRKVYETEFMELWEEIPPRLYWWDHVIAWLWLRGLWP